MVDLGASETSKVDVGTTETSAVDVDKTEQYNGCRYNRDEHS